MKGKSRSFTLVELLVVIVVIGILATLVTLTFSNARKKSEDQKAIAEVNTIASGLDQYSLSNGRIYPKLNCGGADNCKEEIRVSSTVYTALSAYVSSMPASGGKYRFYYAVNLAGTKAVVSVGPGQTGVCNNTGTLPTLASWLQNLIEEDFCYYVAR